MRGLEAFEAAARRVRAMRVEDLQLLPKFVVLRSVLLRRQAKSHS